MKQILSLLCLILLIGQIQALYCSAHCIDYSGPCFNETQDGCWVCATSIFNMLPNSTTSSCYAATQTTLLANQLSMDAMNLFGYSTTNPTPHTCTNYTFSGQYTANDYISKNFTGIPINHYALVIRYNVGYMGTWNTTDVLSLNIQDDEQDIYYDYNYSCSVQENICGGANITDDCIRIREKTIAHNATFIFLNFSAKTTQTDPTIQSWGIKDLIVAAKMCHARCDTCFAATDSDCLSCANGYYLQGNVCLQVCNAGYYKVTDQRQCTQTCPSGYYNISISMSCQKCATGCLVCANAQLCQAWADNRNEEKDQSTFTSKLEFWILLIVVVVLVTAYVTYRCCRKRCKKEEDESDQAEVTNENNSVADNVSMAKDKAGPKVLPEIDKIDNNAAKKGKLLPNQSISSVVETTNQNINMPSIVEPPTLWFNQLVEVVEPQQKKLNPRRRRVRRQHQDEKPSSLDDSSSIPI